MSRRLKRAAPPACVLFDLDGTLLDTAPDLAAALNRLRAARGHSALPLAEIRPTVSHGSPGMLQLCFGLQPADPGYAELNQQLLDEYHAAIAVETQLPDGMAQVLATLETRAIPWGVVTNKPGWLTEPLLRTLALWPRAACVVSGDTLPQRKPEPEPLWHACRQIGVPPTDTLYVGDAERDIQAGNRAGMTTLIAGFGYLGAADRPEDWGAAGVLTEPLDLLDWLGSA